MSINGQENIGAIAYVTKEGKSVASCSFSNEAYLVFHLQWKVDEREVEVLEYIPTSDVVKGNETEIVLHFRPKLNNGTIVCLGRRYPFCDVHKNASFRVKGDRLLQCSLYVF